jgi:hypothetical protein
MGPCTSMFSREHSIVESGGLSSGVPPTFTPRGGESAYARRASELNIITLIMHAGCAEVVA